MRYLYPIILHCLSTFTSKAQFNPYTLANRDVDSLHRILAKTGNDSLKMELDALFSIYYSENNKDSAIYFLNQQLALATRLNILSWQAEALSYLGLLYMQTGNYPAALQSLNAAGKIANGTKFKENEYSNRLITGIPDWFTNKQCLLSIIQFNTALLYEFTNHYDKAKDGYAAAIHMAEKIGDRGSLALYTATLSGIYFYENAPDSAMILLRSALEDTRASKWPYYTGLIYRHLGKGYYNLKDYREALRYYQLGASFNHRQHNFLWEGVCHNGMALSYLAMHRPDSAIDCSRKAAGIFYGVKYGIGKANMYDNFYDAFQMKHNTDSAIKYLSLAKRLRDSINEVDRLHAEQYQVMTFNDQLRRGDAENKRNRRQSLLISYLMLAGLAITLLIAFLLYRNNRQKQRTNTALAAMRDLQDKKISQLDEAVTKRTEQLNSFRQVMATDFHDQTGNMLSAITRQASLLKLKLNGSTEVLPIVESIITNSNELYDSSKDFLWNLNHNSDDPLEVFHYLINYGQMFYNQFNVPFSAEVKGEIQNLQQLDPFASLNLIYIFKEAMTNVIKHANASEVFIRMENIKDKVILSLEDNGQWKTTDETGQHYGLHNIERRCERNNFGFLLTRQTRGTRIEISVPVKINIIL